MLSAATVASRDTEPTLVVVEQTEVRVVPAATAERNAGGGCADGCVVRSHEPLVDRDLLGATKTAAPLIVDAVRADDGTTRRQPRNDRSALDRRVDR